MMEEKQQQQNQQQHLDGNDNMATKALLQGRSMVPTIFSILQMNRPQHDATMCMSQLFDTLTQVDDSSSEAFPSIEWPADDAQGNESSSYIIYESADDEDEDATCKTADLKDAKASNALDHKRRRSYDELQDALRKRLSNMAAHFTHFRPKEQRKQYQRPTSADGA
ncbi:hypothetical protein MPSEU_000435600 [Mayamaea pseudoterrestris]|nr:hypothetical protein MPSEU_000435600 [Mayamaea pseudoterrestris]